MFKTTTRADIVLVPYKGASTVITDTMGGQIDGGFETTSVLLGHLRERTLRGLAVTSPMRLPYLPDIPTMVESGVAEFIASSWSGILAPAGTPKDIIVKLNAEVLKAVGDPEVRRKLEELGFAVRGSSAEELGTMTREQLAKYARVIKEMGIANE